MSAHRRGAVESDDRVDAIPLNATLAYLCAISVPLVKEDALQYLEYVKAYASYQTTLAYLADPPESYMQPSADIIGGLDDIVQKVDNGSYTFQYNFDVDLMILARQANDFHFNLRTGVVGQALFNWGLPYTLTTFSRNGKELPKVYVWEDVYQGVNGSPIATLDNMTVNAYLFNLGLYWNTVGVGESHAEWNIMMRNTPYNFGNGAFFDQSLFGNMVFYYGETLSGTFENGSDFTWPFTAYSQWNMADQGFDSPENIYNKLVLGGGASSSTNQKRQSDTTDSYVQQVDPYVQPYYLPYPNIAPVQTASSTVSSLGPAYPTPDFRQTSFGTGGVVSGYLLVEESVCVISIPGFESGGNSPNGSTFSKPIADTLQACKRANLKQLVVDISGNGGGTVWQGYDTFRHFFPNTDPVQLIRSLGTHVDDVLGTVFTQLMLNQGHIVNSTVQDQVIQFASPFPANQAVNTLDENGQNWTSWKAFFGPVEEKNTSYTNPTRYNFSSTLNPSQGALDENVFGYLANPVPSGYPTWNADDIVIVGDGFCGSTCAVFHELMRSAGGVKSVAFGGLPTYGPMQSVSGTRGGNVLAWSVLDNLASLVREAANNTQVNAIANLTYADIAALPPPLSELRYGSSASQRYNKLDIVQKDNGTPLQFAYQPADCRLFYTQDMILNQTLVWLAGAKVAGGDFGACVKGSTNSGGYGNGSFVFSSPGHQNSFQAANDGFWSGNETWTAGSGNSGKKGSSPSSSSGGRGKKKNAAAGRPSPVAGHGAMLLSAALLGLTCLLVS